MIFEDENGRVNNITYGQFISTSNKLANALRNECGVQRGDRVAILMSQSPDTG
jgi:acyl-coenzyme A synthetase/AMP-(fatty) acid ligase